MRTALGATTLICAGVAPYGAQPAQAIMGSMKDRRPGEGIVERLMPQATPEEQEIALQNLRGLVRVLLEQTIREVRRERELRKSPNGVSIDESL